MKLAKMPFYLLCLASVSLLLASCGTDHGSLYGNTSGGGGSGSSSNFTISGTVSGLSSTALVLQDNGGDNITISSNGVFTFPTAIAGGGTYNVTVLTQPSNPTAQICTVGGATGTALASVTTVQVTCSSGALTIVGGQVTGLLGSGLVLQDNGGNNLQVAANGSFSFSTPIANGSTYSVSVLAQPTTPSQTCTVTNGSGTAAGNVGNVVVTCSAGTLIIGGSVSGLAGTGLILQNNGGGNLAISANGNFQFATFMISGAAYNVTILTQPTGPIQTCTITNGTGTATANVNNIQIVCPAVFHSIGGQTVGLYVPSGQNANMVLQNNGGDNLTVNNDGAFTFVTPIANGSAYDVSIFVQAKTQPQDCIAWGWDGVAVSAVTDVTIDCGHNDWAWMDGANTSDQDAVSTNTTKPVPPLTARDVDTPGGTKYAATWTDLNGNLWLFSGSSHVAGASNLVAFYNTMWEYKGTQDYDGDLADSYWFLVAPPTNLSVVPPARWGAVTWTDAGGDLWLFGGQDSGTDFLNDLWSYNIALNTWTQHAGLFNENGAYGTKGTAAAGNLPGGRWGATARKDASGNVWVFGGFGYGDATSANTGLLNDLWKYSGGQWTWVSGSSTLNQNGVYGTKGTAAGTNVPGGRQASVSWIDASGNFWLFGGYDLSTTGQPNAFNDLWEFSAGQWTWVSGANVVNQTATYGTLGTAAGTNVPGARWSPSAWSDSHGDLWMFGGQGFDATGNGTLSDLWEFKSGQWTWVRGPNAVSQPGDYGIPPNTVVWPHVTNDPGSRWGGSYWTTIDPFGNYEFWMFGGEGFDSTTGPGDGLLNDLWRYLPFP